MSFVDAHVSWRTTRRPIGLFPVPPVLCIKTRLSAQPLIWKERLCTWPHFESEGFWNSEVAYYVREEIHDTITI